MVDTNFSLSRCFFCGLPLPARCTCILISPGIRYLPPKSRLSYAAGIRLSGTISAIFSPSTKTDMPVCGFMSRLPSSRTAFVNAYFIPMTIPFSVSARPCRDTLRTFRVHYITKGVRLTRGTGKKGFTVNGNEGYYLTNLNHGEIPFHTSG